MRALPKRRTALVSPILSLHVHTVGITANYLGGGKPEARATRVYRDRYVGADGDVAIGAAGRR